MTRNIVLILLIFLTSCARQGTLSGGEKDTTPPSILQSTPPDQTINFSGNEIQIAFDELITLNQITQQLIITPTINEDIEISSNKKTVTIKNLELEENTTYTFNFREGIVDLNEKNSADLKLALSTGSYIDSLFIKGTVKTLTNNQPEEDIDILLYDAEDTLNFFEDKPIYLTKSNKDGSYQFNNLKPGSYRIYANQDNNQNGSNQSEEEAFAFISDTLQLTDSLHLRPLLLQNLDIRPLTLIRSRPYGQYFDIGTKKYITEYQIQNLDNEKDKILSNLLDENRKIRIYNQTKLINDTISVQLTIKDSINQVLVDTVEVYFQESKRKPEVFTTTLFPQNRAIISEDFAAQIIFNKPIININPDSINLNYDTLAYQPATITKTEISNDQTKYSLHYQLNKDSLLTPSELQTTQTKKERTLTVSKPSDKRSIIFTLGKGAFISIDGDSTRPFKTTYKIQDKTAGGSIFGKIETKFENFFIELKKEGPKSEPILIPGEKTYAFTNLGPGKYTIRFLIDENNNGVWDQGNILKNIEPELIIYPEDIDPKLKKIPLNSGWTVEQNYTF